MQCKQFILLQWFPDFVTLRNSKLHVTIPASPAECTALSNASELCWKSCRFWDHNLTFSSMGVVACVTVVVALTASAVSSWTCSKRSLASTTEQIGSDRKGTLSNIQVCCVFHHSPLSVFPFPFLFFPPVYIHWEWCHMEWNILLVNWGQLSWLCSSSASYASPVSSPLWKAEKALALCKLCSVATKTSLYYQLRVQQKSKTQPHASHCEEN